MHPTQSDDSLMDGMPIVQLRQLAENAKYPPAIAVFYAGLVYAKIQSKEDAYLYASLITFNCRIWIVGEPTLAYTDEQVTTSVCTANRIQSIEETVKPTIACMLFQSKRRNFGSLYCCALEHISWALGF